MAIDDKLYYISPLYNFQAEDLVWKPLRDHFNMVGLKYGHGCIILQNLSVLFVLPVWKQSKNDCMSQTVKAPL